MSKWSSKDPENDGRIGVCYVRSGLVGKTGEGG